MPTSTVTSSSLSSDNLMIMFWWQVNLIFLLFTLEQLSRVTCSNAVHFTCCLLGPTRSVLACQFYAFFSISFFMDCKSLLIFFIKRMLVLYFIACIITVVSIPGPLLGNRINYFESWGMFRSDSSPDLELNEKFLTAEICLSVWSRPERYTQVVLNTISKDNEVLEWTTSRSQNQITSVYLTAKLLHFNIAIPQQFLSHVWFY